MDTGAAADQPTTDRPIRKVLSVPTLWLIILTGVAFNFSSYAATTFLVPDLQRYFGLPLTQAAVAVGVIVGITGLIGLPAGGFIADRLHRRSKQGRLMFGALSLVFSGGLTWIALSLPQGSTGAFVALFAVGWLFQYNYFTCAYPTIQDVIEPGLRATAMAAYFASQYLLGAAFGPLVVGYLSDTMAKGAMAAASASEMSETFRAIGLHGSLILVPISLLATGVLLLAAARRFPADDRNSPDGTRSTLLGEHRPADQAAIPGAAPMPGSS